MWATSVQNDTTLTLTANGVAVAPGQTATLDYIWSGVAIQVPGVGQVQALEAGDENPGPQPWAVKLTCGNWFAYWGYDGQPTLTIKLFPLDGHYYFSVVGGPQQIAVQQSSPDNVFPVPSLFGDVNHDGINIFTGDVNQTFPLGEIRDGRLQYAVSAFYNSRSVGVASAAQDNNLAAGGWKVIDYPKVVQEGGLFYLLDGMASYVLSLSASGAGYISGGDYHAWTFINSADNSHWTLTDDQGFQYVLANKSLLTTGRVVWNLSSITDTTWPSSVIQVVYNTNAISTISNSIGDVLAFTYDAGACLIAAVHGVITPGGQTAVPSGQIVLVYSGSGNKQLTALQTQAVLPTGGVTPIDAGYLFQYFPPADPLYPLALASVQTPLGAVMSYTYYAGNGIVADGVAYPNLHPVVSVDNRSQPGVIVTKGLYYSYWNWCFDNTQTYPQWNLAKEYAGGVYSSIDDDSPEDPYGHTSYLFFNGQSSTELIFYSGTAGVASAAAMLGKTYWTGNFEIVRTINLALGHDTSSVGAWPGTLVPLTLPSGALVSAVSCRASNGSGVQTDIALAIENADQQIQGVYQTLSNQAYPTVGFELHSLGPVAAVRAWSYTPTCSGMSNLTVTYVMPPVAPSVPPITDVLHKKQVVVSGYFNPVPLTPGSDFIFATPYQNSASVVVNFWNKDGGTSTLVLQCFDAGGTLVGSGTFQTSAYNSATGTITFANAATVARINATSTTGDSYGSNVGISSLYLNYQRAGEPITDDALAWELSYTQNTYQIARPGLAAFDEVITKTSAVDGVLQTTNVTYGNDNTLPYPISIAQTVVKPNQGGGTVTLATQRQLTYAVQQYPALAYNNVLSSVAEVIDNAGPDSGSLAAVAGGVTQWRQWGSAWDQWRQYQLQAAVVSNGFAPSPDASWLSVGTITQRNNRGAVVASLSQANVVASQLFDGLYGNWPVASFINADVSAAQAGWIGFESYESQGAWTLANGAVVFHQAYTGAACYAGSNATVAANRFEPRTGVAYIVAAYVRLDVGAHCVIGFCNNGVWSNQQTIPYSASAATWVYVQAIMLAPSAQQLPTISVTSGAIDHVVFAPVDCQYNATVWNLQQRQSIAGVAPNGAITRAFFDCTGNTLASATPGKGLALIDQAFSAVLGQLWFTSAAPNQSLAIRTPQDGCWDDFTSTSNALFNSAALTNLTLSGNHCLQAQASVAPTQVGSAYATVLPSSGDFVVCAELLIGQSAAAVAQLIGITVRNSGTGGDLWFGIGNGVVLLQDVNSGSVLQSAPLAQIPPTVVLTLIVRQSMVIYAYADGLFLFTQTLAATVAGPVGVRTTWPGSAFYNFGLVSQPELSNASQDGDGTELQFIASTNATDSSVTQNLYGGDLMLYAGKTLATAQTQPSLAPVAGFAALDATTMTVTGSVTQNWPASYNSAPFADSVQHFSDPVLRTKSRGKAGIYTAGNAGAVDYSYGEDIDDYFDFPKDELNTNIATGPTGAQIVTYSNRNGIIFGKARIDPLDNTSLLTGYEYDNALRQTAIYFPSAYTNPTTVNKAIFYRKSTYDFIGNAIALDDSDAGLTQYAYDANGRLRLLQNAMGLAAPTPYCVYHKYDSMGRAIESGVWVGTLSQATTAQLNDPTWPQQNTAWQQRFSWDLPNNNEPYTLGHLTAATTPTFSQWYNYSAQGMPIKVISNAEFLIAELTLDYDDLGRLIAISEPTSQYEAVYRYDEQGRMLSVGTSADPLAYASYTYGDGAVTETLLKGVATRVYTMNALGDMQSIVDDYFSEILYFDTRQNGQPGYLNGQVASAAYSFNWANAPQSYVYEYSYDNFGRLIVAANSTYPVLNLGSVAVPVTYDNNGNILQIERGGVGTTFTYTSNTNQLANAGSGRSFTVDANGNVNSAQALAISSITYSAAGNRPLAVTTANNVVQFVYDASGRRVQRSTNTSTLVYLRDPQGRVLSEKTVDAHGSRRVSYIYGLSGRIALLPQDGSGTQYALLSDHSNSTRVVVDNNKQVVAWYNYDSFGQLAATISNAGTLGLRYLYTGQEWDADLGLYDFAARLYDPAVCRFYAVDPQHQFASPYIYSDNPISFEDPTGEWFGFDDLIATVGGALIGGGLELAREAIAGESFSWKKIALGAAVGAVVGEAALYTAGGSIFAAGGGVAGSAAIGTAAGTVGYGIATGAAVGGVLGGVTGGITHAVSDTGNSLVADIGWGFLGGAVGGAQTGMVAAVLTPVIGAKYLGKPVVGALTNPVVEEALKGKVLGGIAGASVGGVNSILNSIIQQRSVGAAFLDLGKSVVIGGISGSQWNLKNRAGNAVGAGAAPVDEIELAEGLARLLP